jgi:hypothetical protein
MNNRQHFLWISLVATVVWASVMFWEASGFKTDCQPHWRVFRTILSDGACRVTAPVAELELAREPQHFKAIIAQNEISNTNNATYDQWNIELMRVNTCMDCLFIALYWWAFVRLALEAGGWIRRAVIASISVAAVSDVIENVRLFQSLHAARSDLPMTELPGGISAVKWAFFGMAVALLGIAFLKKEKKEKYLDVAIGVLLLASGVLTWVGIIKVPVLGLAIALLSITLLIAIFRFFPIHPLNWDLFLEWIEYFYLIRFQFLGALLLAIVIPVGYFAAPSIFVGLFDARGWISFTLIVWMAVQLAWTVMIASRLILVYGPERFEGIQGLGLEEAKKNPTQIEQVIPRRSGDVTYGQMAVFGFLAAPAVVMLCCGTELAWLYKGLGIAVGIGLAIGLLFVTAALHYRIERWDGARAAARVFPPFAFLKWKQDYSRWKAWQMVDCLLAKLPPRLRNGLIRDGQLRSGHEVATISLLLQLAIYIALGLALRPDLRLPEHQPAALFFAFFLLILLTWLFSGAAFFLDAVRAPVLLTLLALSLLSGAISKTDHQFKIEGSRSAEVVVSPANVVRQWKLARQAAANAPVIVVATAGGGIRAAAWTAQVLTGLEEESRSKACPAKLSTSLLAISSVSGGSVGSMFFLAGYKSKDGVFDADAITGIRFNASRSTLSAVGWGLLFPDAARTLPLFGMFIPQQIDRGWALENAWISGWEDPPNLSNWRSDVANGHRPAAIFNATAAESGQRFLIASTDLDDVVLRDASGTVQDSKTMQFSKSFPGYDVPVATAARLSATFPYVSAEVQASDGSKKARVHVADGGYYDNSGVLSALEWVEEASSELSGHPVLFLLIDSESGTPNPGKRWSWQRQLVSPIDTLLNVRTASQELRSSVELGIGSRQLRSQPGPGLDVKPAVQFLFSSPMPAPLSWHLTPEQHESITASWRANSGAKNNVLRFLGCTVESE